MSNFKPMKPRDINLDNIEFTQMKKLDNGANVMYLNYESKSIYTTTNDLNVTFDSQYWPDNDNSGKWAVKVNLNKSDEFAKFLLEFDKLIKEKAQENSTSWFKKKNMSMDTIDTLYTPQIREDLDPETGEPTGKYPPSFQFKVIKRDGKVNCKVYGKNKTEYNVSNTDGENFTKIEDLIKKGSTVKLLLRCNGIWVANGKFGCTWRAEQLKVTPVESFDECVFDDSDEEDIERIDTNFVNSDSEDSEQEEEKVESTDSEEEPVEKPVEKKVVKKRRVKKIGGD